jgi:hypothetical protein
VLATAWPARSALDATFINNPPTDPVVRARIMEDPIEMHYLQDGVEYEVATGVLLYAFPCD